MTIKIVHMKRSGLTVPKDQLFDLSRGSKKYYLLSNEYTHLPLHKTKAKYQVKTVEDAISNYTTSLKNRLMKEFKLPYQQTPYRSLLLSLYNAYIELKEQNKEMYFGCWCKDELNPKPYDHDCHCDYVKELIYKRYNTLNKVQ